MKHETKMIVAWLVLAAMVMCWSAHAQSTSLISAKLDNLQRSARRTAALRIAVALCEQHKQSDTSFTAKEVASYSADVVDALYERYPESVPWVAPEPKPAINRQPSYIPNGNGVVPNPALQAAPVR